VPLESRREDAGQTARRSRDVPRPVEVRMEDRTWQPGELLDEIRDERCHAGLIRWNGIAAWHYRNRGSGFPNEWREADYDA
jgi:hypothetical protein